MTEVTPDNAASAPVHRYEIYADRSADGGVCLETDLDNEGEWVRYEAHAATVAALEAECVRIERENREGWKQAAHHRQRADAADRRVAALEAEVERLQRELTLANGWSDDPQVSARTAVENANALTDIQRQRADAAERRVAELEVAAFAARGRLNYLNSLTGEKIDADIIDKINAVLTGARAK